MINPKLIRDLLTEVTFETNRSSGAGGQNVNKVSTKVELQWSVAGSALLTQEARELLLKKLSNKLTKEGVLRVTCEATRSQLMNKEGAIKKFVKLLEYAFHQPKKRIPTQVSSSAKNANRKEKELHSEKKQLRQFKNFE